MAKPIITKTSKPAVPRASIGAVTRRRKGVFSWLSYIVIAAGVMVGVGVLVVLAQFFYGFPIPFYSSDFGAYHVYNEVTLAGVMHKISIPNKILDAKYYGSCGTITESGTVSSTGKFYNCTSVYDVLYAGSGNICTDYVITSAAMLKAGYRLDPMSIGCSGGSNSGLIAGYDSSELTSLGHGDGRLFCYYPVYNDYISSTKLRFPPSTNNFNCLVAVNTSG